MKQINKLFLVTVASAMFVSCIDEYKSDFMPEKPKDVSIEEYLNQYDLLNTYIDRSANQAFKLGMGTTASEFVKKESMYSLAGSNFDEVTGKEINHISIIDDEGSASYYPIENFVQTAAEAGLSVFGHTLCWHSQQNSTYLNELIAPIIIPGEYSSGTTEILDFEDDPLGTTYELTGNSTATVVEDPRGISGHVLQIGNDADPASYSFPKFNVTLPEGRVLGDYLTVTIDFLGTGSTGLYGGGMRMGINTNEMVNYNSPAGFGCPDGNWGRGYIKLDFADLNLTEAEKQLTEFTLLIGSGTGSGNYYIDNITMQWEHNVIGEIIEKTPEEKKEIIGGELERWIAGAMEVCEGYVTAWDVVNEPMSDNESYMLRTAGTDPDPDDSFYWQEYLGDNYARDAVRYARQYFKEYGGNENELKLFINEYGLEEEGNLKCKRLLQMIEQWEVDGTKIDGIGSQMHVTYSLLPAQQQKNKENITNMFELLAATGKLIRISDLDMRITDENDAIIPLVNITFEQQMAMAEYYNFIIRTYFELIPAAQRYGITIGKPVDTGNYIGLWNSGYNRKATYPGFVYGLRGEEYIK